MPDTIAWCVLAGFRITSVFVRLAFQCLESVCDFMIGILNGYLSREVTAESKSKDTHVLIMSSSRKGKISHTTDNQKERTPNTGGTATDTKVSPRNGKSATPSETDNYSNDQQQGADYLPTRGVYFNGSEIFECNLRQAKKVTVVFEFLPVEDEAAGKQFVSSRTDHADNSLPRRNDKSDVVQSENSTFQKEASKELPDDAELRSEYADAESEKNVNKETVASCKTRCLFKDTKTSSEILDIETKDKDNLEVNSVKEEKVREMHDIMKAHFVGVESENMQQTSTHEKRDKTDRKEIPLEKDKRMQLQILPGDQNAKEQLQIGTHGNLKPKIHVTETKHQSEQLQDNKRVKQQLSRKERKQLRIHAKNVAKIVQSKVRSEEDKALSSKVLPEKANRSNEQQNVKENMLKAEKSQTIPKEKCVTDISSGQIEIAQAQKLPLKDKDFQLICGKESGGEELQNRLKIENKAQQQNLLPETAEESKHPDDVFITEDEVVQTEIISPKVCESNQQQNIKESKNKSENKEHTEGKKFQNLHLSETAFELEIKEQESEETGQKILKEREMDKSQIPVKKDEREQLCTAFDIELEIAPEKYYDQEGKATHLEISNMLFEAEDTKKPPKKETEAILPIILLQEEKDGRQAQVQLVEGSKAVFTEIDLESNESVNLPISSQKEMEGIEKRATLLSKIFIEECELVQPHILPDKRKTLQIQVNTSDESEVMQQKISEKGGEIIESKSIYVDNESKYGVLPPESEIVKPVVSFEEKRRTKCAVISDKNKEVKVPRNEDDIFLTKEREDFLTQQQQKVIQLVEECHTINADVVDKYTDKSKLDVLYNTDDLIENQRCAEHGEEMQIKFPSEISDECMQVKTSQNLDDPELQKKPMTEKDLSVTEYQKHETEQEFSNKFDLLHTNAPIFEPIIEKESSALQNFEIEQSLLPEESVTRDNVSSKEIFTSQDRKTNKITVAVISSDEDAKDLKDDSSGIQKITWDKNIGSDASDDGTMCSNIYEKGPSIILSEDFLLDPHIYEGSFGAKAEHSEFDFSEENRTNTLNKIDIKLYNNFTGSEIRANDFESFTVDWESDKGKVADDYDPLTEVPKYWERIRIENDKYVLEKSEIKCFIRNPDYLEAQTDENAKVGIVKDQTDIEVDSVPREIKESDLTENSESCTDREYDNIKQSMHSHLDKGTGHTPKDQRMSDDMDTSTSDESETVPQMYSDPSTDEIFIKKLADLPNTDATNLVNKSVALELADESIISGIKTESKVDTGESILHDRQQTDEKTPEKLFSVTPSNQSARLECVECGKTQKETDISSYEETDYVKTHDRILGDILAPDGPFIPIAPAFLINPYDDPSRRYDIKSDIKKLEFDEEYSVDKWNRSDKIFYYNVMGCDVPEDATSIPSSKEGIGEIESFYDPSIQTPMICDGMCIINNDYVLGKRDIKAYDKNPETDGEKERKLSEDIPKTTRSKLKIVKVPAHSPPKRKTPAVGPNTCPIIKDDKFDSDQKAEDTPEETKQESRDSPKVSPPKLDWYEITVAAEKLQEMLMATGAAGDSDSPPKID